LPTHTANKDAFECPFANNPFLEQFDKKDNASVGEVCSDGGGGCSDDAATAYSVWLPFRF